jgi:hypothetical protein
VVGSEERACGACCTRPSDCSLSASTFVAEISVNGVRFTTLADPEGNAFDVAAA